MIFKKKSLCIAIILSFILPLMATISPISKTYASATSPEYVRYDFFFPKVSVGMKMFDKDGNRLSDADSEYFRDNPTDFTVANKNPNWIFGSHSEGHIKLGSYLKISPSLVQDDEVEKDNPGGTLEGDGWIGYADLGALNHVKEFLGKVPEGTSGSPTAGVIEDPTTVSVPTEVTNRQTGTVYEFAGWQTSAADPLQGLVPNPTTKFSVDTTLVNCPKWSDIFKPLSDDPSGVKYYDRDGKVYDHRLAANELAGDLLTEKALKRTDLTAENQYLCRSSFNTSLQKIYEHDPEANFKSQDVLLTYPEPEHPVAFKPVINPLTEDNRLAVRHLDYASYKSMTPGCVQTWCLRSNAKREYYTYPEDYPAPLYNTVEALEDADPDYYSPIERREQYSELGRLVAVYREKAPTVSWKKTDNKGNLLGGATFELAAKAGTKVTVADCTTNDCANSLDKDPVAGQFKVTDLAPDSYTLRETAAPSGYLTDSTPKTFTLNEKERYLTIAEPFVNNPIPPRPEGKVEFGKWVEQSHDCASHMITEKRQKTTTEYVWSDDSKTWVAGEPVTTSESQTREMTIEERRANCSTPWKPLTPATPKPKDKVEYGNWVKQSDDCAKKQVTETRTVTTTKYVWSDTAKNWVEGKPETSTETQTRAMTDEERKASCAIPWTPLKPATPKPADKVVTGEWVKQSHDCAKKQITETRETSTTKYVWSKESKTWVEDQPVKTSETKTREMSDAEHKANCSVPWKPLTPAIHKPAKDKPASNKPAEKPQLPPAPTNLPDTGSDGSVGLIGYLALLAMLGAALPFIRKQRH